MSSNLGKILIFGGPANNPRAEIPGARLVPFTLGGLVELYHWIPSCDTLIYCPDRSYFSQVYSREEIQGASACFNIDGSAIEKDCAAYLTDCLRTALSDLGAAISSGTNIAFCFPEDYPSWTPAEQVVVSDLIPALRVVRETRWMDQLDGPEDLLQYAGDERSTLAFQLSRKSIVEQGIMFSSNIMPNDGSSMCEIVGVLEDRKGTARMVMHRIGAGELLLCPELYWNGILSFSGIRPEIRTQYYDRAIASSTQLLEDQVTATDSQNQKMTEEPLINRLPKDQGTIADWNRKLGWDRPHHLRKGIQNLDELAKFVDHLVANKPAERFRAADPITAPDIGRPIVPDSVRSALARKMRAIPNIDPALARFLKDAIARITACVDYSRPMPK